MPTSSACPHPNSAPGRLLAMLLEHGSVTTETACQAGIATPVGAVATLRRRGYRIESQLEPTMAFSGRGRIARYTLVTDRQDTLTAPTETAQQQQQG